VTVGILTGIITMLFGIGYTVMAYTLPKAAIGNPMAPTYFPIMLGIGMTILGICLFVSEVRNKEAGQRPGEKKTGKGMAFDTKMIIFTCVMGIVYGLIFNMLGYVLSTFIFLGSLLFALNGKGKWKSNIIVALSFSVIIYFIFQKLLNIPLPMMPILQI
jgi:Tripartite tricarboxylate transporter TctB family.